MLFMIVDDWGDKVQMMISIFCVLAQDHIFQLCFHYRKEIVRFIFCYTEVT